MKLKEFLATVPSSDAERDIEALALIMIQKDGAIRIVRGNMAPDFFYNVVAPQLVNGREIPDTVKRTVVSFGTNEIGMQTFSEGMRVRRKANGKVFTIKIGENATPDGNILAFVLDEGVSCICGVDRKLLPEYELLQ